MISSSLKPQTSMAWISQNHEPKIKPPSLCKLFCKGFCPREELRWPMYTLTFRITHSSLVCAYALKDSTHFPTLPLDCVCPCCQLLALTPDTLLPEECSFVLSRLESSVKTPYRSPSSGGSSWLSLCVVRQLSVLSECHLCPGCNIWETETVLPLPTPLQYWTDSSVCLLARQTDLLPGEGVPCLSAEFCWNFQHISDPEKRYLF